MHELANPLLASTGLPDFARIEPAHVVPAVRAVIAEALQQMEQLEATVQPTWEATIGRLEEIEFPFQYAWSPVTHLFGVKNSPELRTAYETVLPEVIQWSLRVRQSDPVYKALVTLKQSPGWNDLDAAQQRIVADRILDAELSGIALTGTARERFNQIEQELSQLSTTFSNHVLDATKAYALDLKLPEEVDGVPRAVLELAAESYRQAHPNEPFTATAETGPWRFTLEFPLYGPFMEHCRRRDLREQLYRAFITRAASDPFDNTPLIPRILQLRQEQAQLLGYPDYASVSLVRKMAGQRANVQKMFDDLRESAWQAGQRDLQELKDFKQTQGDTAELALWDIAFWAERLRESRYAYTDEEVRPYFPFERVLDGLFRLLERLFGVTVRPAHTDVSVWHDDVRYYEVYTESGERIAGFYLDPYSRPENKRSGAWMDDCLGRRRRHGQIQLPVAHLVCNQTPPVGDKPSLMKFAEVETLFHEFGHGLQHMLTMVDRADAAGIHGVEWDAVELPSQFMENWCYHRETLLGMTGHYQTGEPLPEELYRKIVAARTYRAGSMMLRQLMLGMTDMSLHSDFDPAGSQTIFEVQREIAKVTSPLPPLPEDRFLCSFQHIFAGGYAAGYYSYKWAEILSADAFSAFEEVGLDNDRAVADLGRRFRRTVLALGGSRHPLDVFREFRGREPSVEPLLRHNGLLPAAK